MVEGRINDTNIENSIDADSSNNVDSMFVQVESVDMLVENNAVEENIVEGKKFATTYLIPENDEQQTKNRNEKSIEKEVVKSIPIVQPEKEENEQLVSENFNDGERKRDDDDSIDAKKSDPTQKASLLLIESLIEQRQQHERYMKKYSETSVRPITSNMVRSHGHYSKKNEFSQKERISKN